MQAWDFWNNPALQAGMLFTLSVSNALGGSFILDAAEQKNGQRPIQDSRSLEQIPKLTALIFLVVASYFVYISYKEYQDSQTKSTQAIDAQTSDAPAAVFESGDSQENGIQAANAQVENTQASRTRTNKTRQRIFTANLLTLSGSVVRFWTVWNAQPTTLSVEEEEAQV